MDKLRDKLEALLKNLAAMKPKGDSNSLVPALKMPSVKPLSMPSATSAVPKQPKMPGISPTSNKDPKKMAEQLRNPKQKKPKIEVLKVEKNGQWSLEKFGENNSV
jgi:hypothetical protein